MTTRDPKIRERLAGPDVTRAQFDDMFIQAGKRITELRAEAAKFRHQRNEARAETDALKRRVAELEARLAGSR